MRRLAFVVVVVCACTPEHDYPSIEVDIAANCNRADILVAYEELDGPERPWTRLLGAAADAVGQNRMWALVEYRTPDGIDRLGLWHLDGDEVDRSLMIDVPVASSDTLALRPGPTAGEAWLVRRAPDVFQLARVDANDPVGTPPVLSINHAGYPPIPGGSAFVCDEDGDGEGDFCDGRSWPKSLAFIDGDPFLVAVPTSSVDDHTRVYVSRLSSTLAVPELIELDFLRACIPSETPFGCEEDQLAYSYPRIAVAATQDHPGGRTWSFFAVRDLGEPEFGYEYREAVVVTIGLDDARNPGGFVAHHPAGPLETFPSTGAQGLAVDNYYAYFLDHHEALGPWLNRRANADASFEGIDIALTETTTLLQLEEDIALADVDESTWTVTKLFPDAPNRSETTAFEASSPIVDVVSAGPGSLLLFEEAGGPTLLSVACAEP